MCPPILRHHCLLETITLTIATAIHRRWPQWSDLFHPLKWLPRTTAKTLHEIRKEPAMTRTMQPKATLHRDPRHRTMIISNLFRSILRFIRAPIFTQRMPISITRPEARMPRLAAHLPPLPRLHGPSPHPNETGIASPPRSPYRFQPFLQDTKTHVP